MRVALISSFAIKTPPATYGGLERCVYDHAVGLEKLGHEVTIIASQGSKAPHGVRLVETVKDWPSLTPEEQRELAKKDRVWNGWRAQEEEAYGYYGELLPSYDVVGDHTWSKWSYGSKKDEIVGTCHSIKPYNVKPPREYPLLTGVSKAHSRLLARELHTPVRTLWNPVNVQEFTLQKEKQDRVLSLNRVMATKGVHLFVNIINDLKLKADVAGDDSTLVPDQGYVQWVKESCKKSAYLTYHGLVTDEQRKQLLRDAKVLVCLKDMGYEEVFGLQAVEAMACGTPVIALNSWGFADTIINDKNGRLCNTIEEVKDAIKAVMNGTLKFDPDFCRQSAERFSRENSAKGYERLLEAVKHGCRW